MLQWGAHTRFAPALSVFFVRLFQSTHSEWSGDAGEPSEVRKGEKWREANNARGECVGSSRATSCTSGSVSFDTSREVRRVDVL